MGLCTLPGLCPVRERSRTRVSVHAARPAVPCRTVPGTVVGGSFGSVVREHVEQSLRLVQVGESGLGVDVHPVTLISTATMEHLQSTVQAPPEHWADRFRMLLELDGLAPYEEESWCGREVTVGEAVLVVGQLVPRVERDAGAPEGNTSYAGGPYPWCAA